MEKENKVKNILIGAIGILIIIGLAIAIILNKDVIFKSNTKSENNTVPSNNTSTSQNINQTEIAPNSIDNTVVENNETDSEKESNKKIEKIIKMQEETKNYVRDADYYKNKEEKNVTHEYSPDVKQTYSASKNLKAPYIMLNSADANTANNEIKKIYEEYYNLFGTNAGSNYLYYIPSIKYISFKNNNILSVVVEYFPGITGTSYSEYNIKAFNFDLDTLELVNFEELANSKGYSKEKINSIINNINKSSESEEKLELKQNEGFIGLDGNVYVICKGGYSSGGVRSPYIGSIVNLTTNEEDQILYEFFYATEHEEATVEDSESVKIFNNSKISNIEYIQKWFAGNGKEKKSNGIITIIAKSVDGNKVWENTKDIEVVYPGSTTRPFHVINCVDKKLYVFYLIDDESSYEYESLSSQINIIDLETGKIISEVKIPYLYRPTMAITKDGHKIIAGFGSQGAYSLDFVVLNSDDSYEKIVRAGAGEITINTTNSTNNSLKTLEIIEENNEEYLVGTGYSVEDNKTHPKIMVPVKVILEKDKVTLKDCIIK